MIVMRTPKGWTGPAEVDGRPVEGTWRAHQVPLAEVRTNPAHLRQLEEWMRSYRPGELFDGDGQPRGEILGFVPPGERRMGSNPHANGGLLLRDLTLPDFREYAVTVDRPGATMSEPTRVLGTCSATWPGSTRRRRTSGWSGRTRRSRTGWTRSSRSRARPGRRPRCRWTSTWPRTAGSWRSSPRPPARAGWRATC